MKDVASVALGIVYLPKALESVKSTPYARCKLGRFQVALDSSNPLEHVLWTLERRCGCNKVVL